MRFNYDQKQFSEQKLQNLEKQLKKAIRFLASGTVLGIISTFTTSNTKTIIGSLASLLVLMSLAYFLEFSKSLHSSNSEVKQKNGEGNFKD